ncbi:MAG: hypothetical protein Q7T81_02235 [Pseudolabrys sp.]|nr:hypothetical protein [Pseudolabrys sp.]
MSQNVILALAWLFFSAGLIAAFVMLIGRFDDRAGRRKAAPAPK